MDKKAVYKELKDTIIIPVVRVESPEDAEKTADVLAEAGIKAIEITMTVSKAEKVIEKLKEKFSDILIGAGTVLNKEQAENVIKAGADFVVSPCFLQEVVKYCNEQDILVAPGTATPTEIITAYNYGADFIKVFPASTLGGPKYIKAVKSVYPHIDIMPTGGVNASTAGEFLKAGASFLGVGSEIVNSELVKNNRFQEIKIRAEKILNAIK